MLFKGILHILICVLFLSRLIPKYADFRDTGQVRLFGHVWEDSYGLLVIAVIAAVTLSLLVLGARNIWAWLASRRDQG
ncbi:MAG: hypothetical protein OXC41_02980 [Gammaproteobacteria bacterium]|nr:hypothetical protein [Gammaproteobacteria bacterium]